jgi:hypothetical protein
MKEIRLQRMVDKETCNKIIELYKQAKDTHEIDKILTVKSFITRIIEAQNEVELHFDGQYYKTWTTLENYVNNVINSPTQWPNGIHTSFEYIMLVTNNSVCPFGYKREKHFNRTL